MQLVIGIAIPFLGTTIGSAMVFFMKNKINTRIEKLLLGFASGVILLFQYCHIYYHLQQGQ